MHKIKYSRFPNNEVRAVHYYSPEPRPSQDKTACEELPCPDCTASPARDVSSEAVPAPSLDISSDFRKSGFGKTPKRTKFGSVAKNTLLRAGGALDTMQAKPYHYVMLTGTLPGGTPQAMQAMADWSSWITESCTHWLTNNTKSEYYFYVWELQERGALHIHLCVYVPDTYSRCWVLYKWWDKWLDVIQGVGTHSGTDMWLRKDGTHHKRGHRVLQADAQSVYSSVCAYLSGYCGGAKDKHRKDAVSPYYPTRWWGYSRALSKLLKGLTETIVVEHTNYRDAHYEILLHYEIASHDTTHCHGYPHKAGIGSTVVSYHPEDKGQLIWSRLRKPMYNQRQNPNTSSLIRALLIQLPLAANYLRVWGNSKDSALKPLLQQSGDLISLGSLSRYTLHLRDLRLAADIACALSTLREDSPTLVRIQKSLGSYARWLKEVQPAYDVDVHGWVLNTKDTPHTVDKILNWGDTRTSEPERGSGTSVGDSEPSSVQIPVFPPGSQWSYSDT